MDLRGKSLILASASPRRKELLGKLDIPFTIDTGNTFCESIDPSIRWEDVPARMSEGKSTGFHRPLSDNELLLTADTMVILPRTGTDEGEILGKPASEEDAKRMLRDLSGREHLVVTAVTLRDCRIMKTVTDTTTVTFRELKPEEIDFYVKKYRPLDKAGAYAIQEWIGEIGITSIRGSYFNVVGLPTHVVHSLLEEFLSI